MSYVRRGTTKHVMNVRSGPPPTPKPNKMHRNVDTSVRCTEIADIGLRSTQDYSRLTASPAESHECGRTPQREHWQEDNDNHDGGHGNAHIDIEHATHDFIITHTHHATH